MMDRIALRVAIAGMLCCLSCTGQIGTSDELGPGGGHASGSGSGAGGSRATGSGGTSGASGTAGGGTSTGEPGSLDPGTLTVRRLNRSEYNNTVRDLLGTSLRPADAFPQDESSNGFDTIGDTLSISPVHAEQFESSAVKLVEELFALPATDKRRSAVLSCDPAADANGTCTRTISSSFARRAFRRPVQTAEIDSFVQVAQAVAKEGTAVDGLKGALEAVLLSPHFIFRMEVDQDPASKDVHPVNDYELATRLSYFLWSSMPDEPLLAAAQAGELTGNSGALGQHFTRMLADPKAAAFAENFAGQWLTLRFLATRQPSTAIYAQYDDALRTSAQTEHNSSFKT